MSGLRHRALNPLPRPPGSPPPSPPPSFLTSDLRSTGQALPSVTGPEVSHIPVFPGRLWTHFTPRNNTARLCLDLMEGLVAAPPDTAAARPTHVAGAAAPARGPG